MAKAQFYKGQRVWVEKVGAWAVIERIVPVWAKGFDEPVKVTYEVGLGREFLADELQTEQGDLESDLELGHWRLLRCRNKWQAIEDCAHHPYPGSFPVVVTEQTDWGGWRVPGAEYDRDPVRIEFQARLIAAAPDLVRLAKDVTDLVAEAPHEAPPELIRLAKAAETILNRVIDDQAPPVHGQAGVEDEASPPPAQAKSARPGLGLKPAEPPVATDDAPAPAPPAARIAKAVAPRAQQAWTVVPDEPPAEVASSTASAKPRAKPVVENEELAALKARLRRLTA